MASASRCGSPGGVSSPVVPSLTSSRELGKSEATTGRAMAPAGRHPRDEKDNLRPPAPYQERGLGEDVPAFAVEDASQHADQRRVSRQVETFPELASRNAPVEALEVHEIVHDRRPRPRRQLGG